MRINICCLTEILILVFLSWISPADLCALGDVQQERIGRLPVKETAAVVIDTVAPSYPELAIRAATQGDVAIKVGIGGDGVVFSAEVVKSHGLFNDPALDASKQWKFSRDPSRERREAILTFSFRRIGVKEGSEPDNYPTSSFTRPFHMDVNHVMPWLIKLEENPGTWQIGKSVCEVHRETLKLDIVPISYGLPSSDKFWQQHRNAEKERFPYANKSSGGGCIVRYASKAEVLFCQSCRDVRSAWLERRKERDR